MISPAPDGWSALSLCVAVLLAAAPVAAEKTWWPKPIFTSALCTKEIANAKPALDKKMEDLKLVVPKSNRGDLEVVAAYEAFLEKIDREMQLRAAAQERAAGKWKGKTRSRSCAGARRTTSPTPTYRIGSCQVVQPKIPLKMALAVATAAAEPTEVDKELETTIRDFIAMKKEREACRKVRPWKNARACLKRTTKFDWLDRYHLTEDDKQVRKGSGDF